MRRYGCMSALGALAVWALAGCGGGSMSGGAMSAASGPDSPLTINQSNATATAAEAIVTTATLSDTATSAGASTAPPSAVAASLGAMNRRVVQRSLPNHVAAAGTATYACAAGGDFTAVTSTDGKTLTVTFADCSEVAGTSVAGTQTYSDLMLTTQSSSDSLSANVSDALTIVVGTVSYAETGNYAFSFSGNKTANGAFSMESFELSGSTLAVMVSKNGAVSDSTLTDFDFSLEEDLTMAPHQLYSSFHFALASSLLDGKITVSTTAQLKQIADSTHLYPYAGQILIMGADNERLQATILGDETFVPPAGEGQIELQLDPGNGSFGPPTWLDWATLTAA
jgi:hypothetical protein